jgi:hypothetical protein
MKRQIRATHLRLPIAAFCLAKRFVDKILASIVHRCFQDRKNSLPCAALILDVLEPDAHASRGPRPTRIWNAYRSGWKNMIVSEIHPSMLVEQVIDC